MTGDEKDLFEKEAWCDDMCRLRKWDDGAKVLGLDVPGVDTYLAMMERIS